MLIGAGLVVAGSGLWMTLFYAGAPGGDLLWAVRVMVSTAMAASTLAGFAAIRRRNLPAHRAWMIRAFALALGAGTQMLTQGIGEAVFGVSDLSTALSVSSGWILNAAVAEWVIRRPAARRRRRARARAVPLSSAQRFDVARRVGEALSVQKESPELESEFRAFRRGSGGRI